MTHRKHAAALLTAVLLLALTACGRQTAAASDPAQTPAAPAVETPVIAAPAATPTPAAGKTPAATAGRPGLNGACSKTTASRPTTTRISETASIRSM